MCSPSAVPQRVTVSQRGALKRIWHTSFYIWCPGFAAAFKCPFNHLPPEDQVACVPGSHGTITIREAVLGRPPQPGHCTGSTLKHTPNFFLLAGPGASASACIWSLQRCPRQCRPEDAIFALFPCLTKAHWYLPERSLCTHLEPQFLQLLPRRHLQINWL